MTSFLYQQLSNHGGNLKRKKPMIMSHYIYKDALHNVPFVKYDSPVTARKVAHNSQCLVDLIPPPSDQLEYMELLYKNTQHRKCRTIRKIFCCGAWNLCWVHAPCPTCPSLEEPICQSCHFNVNMTSLLYLHFLKLIWQNTFERIFRTTKLQNSTRCQKSCWNVFL